MTRTYLTTPIYYVNDRPHIGHTYTTVLADILARGHRILGDEVHFLTGTDEHGLKVQEAAARANRTPQEHADLMVTNFRALWERLDVSHDDFIRTTETRHAAVVGEVLTRLHDAGEIEKREYVGWYCTPCERYWTGKDLVDGACPNVECRRPVEEIAEPNYFFTMSRHRDWLLEHVETHPEFVLPESRRNELLGFLRKPLEDLCISRLRKRLGWGIPLPFDEEYVTYVWFDALLNYVSAIGYTADEDRFRTWWPARAHLIGKDILTTHGVYWPTMLHALGIEPPRTLLTHGWWTDAGGAKASKSRGGAPDPAPLLERFGPDPVRFYLLREMTVGQDAGFDEDRFVGRYNTDLANNLGNLLSRTVRMVERYRDGTVPAPAGGEEETDRELREAVGGLAGAMEEDFRALRPDRFLGRCMDAVDVANRYVERNAPWTLAKSGPPERLDRVLFALCETLRVLAAALEPVLPRAVRSMREQLGVPDRPATRDDLGWSERTAGAKVRPGDPLFPRAERERNAK